MAAVKKQEDNHCELKMSQETFRMKQAKVDEIHRGKMLIYTVRFLLVIVTS